MGSKRRKTDTLVWGRDIRYYPNSTPACNDEEFDALYSVYEKTRASKKVGDRGFKKVPLYRKRKRRIRRPDKEVFFSGTLSPERS